MSFFVKTSPAPVPRSRQISQIGLLYAGILVAMAVTQLFTFDEFIELIYSFNLPVNDVIASSIAPVIVVCEVFALPFLLRMRTSVAFRWLSMFLGWSVAVIWFGISFWTANAYPVVASVGFFGTVVELVPGWWAVSLSALFGVMAAWTSWGMWPSRVNSRKAKK